jgi:hypothetical protein
MKYLGLVAVLCALAAAAPARAFEIQGEKATLEDGTTQFAPPGTQFVKPDYTHGSSLALPYIGEADSGFIADYGNSIPIPGPGIDRPAPAWALQPSR